MPELPEVETVRRGLLPVLLGRRLVRVTVRRGDLRFPLPGGFADAISGRGVEAIDRRAKYLLVRLSGGLVLIMHLGMSGRFNVTSVAGPSADPFAPDPHDHVVFETDGGVALCFRDPRRFGFMDLCPEERLAAHWALDRLGPEPLTDDFSGPSLSGRLAGRMAPIKGLLLDQRVVAGLGNIYACESLFRARLSPRRSAGTVVGGRADRLVAAIRAVLTEAIEAGGSTLRDHRRPSGELGCFQTAFAVYGRAGEPCPGCTCAGAGGGIRRIVQAGRSTFYCARRQR